MKKLFTLTMLISFAMVCSCQKQGSAAERQLAQRKAELDAREKALDEREKALDEREKTLAERENPTASAIAVPSGRPLRDKTRDPEEAKAEFEQRIKQLPPDARRLIPDPEQVRAKREAKMQERRAKRERRLQEQMEEQERMKPSGSAALPAAEAPSPPPLAVYPQPEASSASPSPTPR